MSALELKHLRVGENRGIPRIFIESARLRDAGLEVGARYRASYDEKAKKVTLVVDSAGERLVCRRKRGDEEVPLIDLNNRKLDMFGSAGRVVVAIHPDHIEITLHHHSAREVERVERLVQQIAAGSVDVGELCAGGGVMAEAVHAGLTDGGLSPHTAFVVEKEPEYLASLQRNCGAVDKRTLLVEGGIQEVDYSVLPKVSILAAGLPCTGASLSGRAKNKLAAAEEHESAGHLFVAFLRIIEQCNPAVVVLENVVPYASTMSFQVIKACLTEWGYSVEHRVLGRSLGAFEDRERMVMLATSRGLDVRFEDVLPVSTPPVRLAELLEDVPVDSERFKTYDYLKAKEERDIAAGKGFRQQLLTPDATSCGTIGRGYNKVRSTEPRLVHPTDAQKSRLFTPTEHARVKGIPERLVAGLSDTTAHEILGQSVLFPVFRAVGRALAIGLQRIIEPAVATTRGVVDAVQVIAQLPGPSAGREDQLDLFATAA